LAVFSVVDAHRVLLEVVFEIIGGRLRDAAMIIFYWSNVVPLLVYSMDILLKLLVFGLRNYCRSAWNIYDLVFVLGPTTLYQVLFSFDMELHGKPYGAGLAVLVLHLAVIPSLCGRMWPLSTAAKNRVSQNKMRFVDITENIDLDLTYISGILIAMGVPCTDFKRKLYRNPLDDVVRFFKARHESQFRIYNACPELPYPMAPFEAIGGFIVQLQVLDHTPPTMNQFVRFLTDARQWRNEDEQNIIVVHCKGGKGRTGSLCAAWLLYSRETDTAEEALGTLRSDGPIHHSAASFAEWKRHPRFVTCSSYHTIYGALTVGWTLQVRHHCLQPQLLYACMASTWRRALSPGRSV